MSAKAENTIPIIPKIKPARENPSKYPSLFLEKSENETASTPKIIPSVGRKQRIIDRTAAIKETIEKNAEVKVNSKDKKWTG